MPLPIDKFTMIVIRVGPEVVTQTIRHILPEQTCIDLTALESYCPRTPLHVVFELTFIATSLLEQNSETFDGIVLPFAYIR